MRTIAQPVKIFACMAVVLAAQCAFAHTPMPNGDGAQNELNHFYTLVLERLDNIDGDSGAEKAVETMSTVLASGMSTAIIEAFRGESIQRDFVLDGCGLIDSRNCFPGEYEVESRMKKVGNTEFGCLRWAGSTDDNVILARLMVFVREGRDWKFVLAKSYTIIEEESHDAKGLDSMWDACWAE